MAKAAATGETSEPKTGMTNQERRDAKRRFESVGRRMEKVQSQVEDLVQALADTDPTDFEGLVQAQRRLADAKAELAALEDEWLELSELFA